MADRLLDSFTPQDGEEPLVSSQPKRPRRIPISYSMAVSGSDSPPPVPEDQLPSNLPSVSTISDQEIESIYKRLLPKLSVPSSTVSLTVTTEDLEKHYNKCCSDINTIRSDLTISIASIQSDVERIKTDMEKQNAIILGIQQEVTAALQDFARKLYDLTLGQAKSSHLASGPHHQKSLQGAATSQTQPWSGGSHK
jgi:hypothetical protein